MGPALDHGLSCHVSSGCRRSCLYGNAGQGGLVRRAARDASWVDACMHEGAGLAGKLGPKGSDRVFRLHPSEASRTKLLWLAGFLLWIWARFGYICLLLLLFSTRVIGPRATTNSKLLF